MSGRAWVWRALFLSGSIGLVAALYHFTEATAPGVDVYDYLVGKTMETPLKWFLNGRAGQFVRFKFLGNVCWLALLGVPAWLAAPRSPTRAELAVLLATGAIGLMIVLKGTINFRYQATLTPLLIAAGLLAARRLWLAGATPGTRDHRVALAVLPLLILAAVGYHRWRDAPQFWGIAGMEAFVPGSILQRVRELVGTKHSLLVANESVYYYMTDQYGLYYSEVGQDFARGVHWGIYTPSGIDRAIAQRPPADAARHLRETLGLEYVLVSESMIACDRELRAFLNVTSKIVEHTPPYMICKIGDAVDDWVLPGGAAHVTAQSGFEAEPHSAAAVLREFDRPAEYAKCTLPFDKPIWLEIDLGADRPVDELVVTFFNRDLRSSEFKWLCRRNAAEPWTTLATRSKNERVIDRVELPDTTIARQIRLELLAAPHPWGSYVKNVHVYGRRR